MARMSNLFTNREALASLVLAIGLLAVPLIARFNDKAPFVLPGPTVWYVFATAGFVGGLAYWSIAGRSA